MIDKASLLWAIQFIQKHSDGDLFPRVLEFDAIAATLPITIIRYTITLSKIN